MSGTGINVTMLFEEHRRLLHSPLVGSESTRPCRCQLKQELFHVLEGLLHVRCLFCLIQNTDGGSIGNTRKATGIYSQTRSQTRLVSLYNPSFRALLAQLLMKRSPILLFPFPRPCFTHVLILSLH